MKDVLAQLSQALSGAARAASPSLVMVDAGDRQGATGTVWSTDGHLLTAAHKLRREEGINVGLPDGGTTSARLVGLDPQTDLALLQVSATGLAVPAWSPIDQLAVGQLVLAVARPGRTVRASLGVLSTLSDGEFRTPNGGRLDRYIESDIGGRAGFSGGLLLDTEGRAIGLNTGAIVRGASLTIPGATLTRVVGELSEHGRVRRGFLGIAAYPVALPKRLAEHEGQTAGLVVVGLEAEGPADRAGLLLGDVLLRVAGNPVTDLRELQGALDGETIGKEVEVRFVRAGELRDQRLTVGSRAR